MNQIDLEILTGISNELKNLISENPELPIIFLAGSCANLDKETCTCCYETFAEIGEIIDTEEFPVCSDFVFHNRDEFYEVLYECLEDDYKDLDKTSLDDLFQKYVKEYEPHLKKVIAVYVDN